MLRKTRIILAALFLIGLTLLFVGIGQQWWGWMAKLQFLPSCLALNTAVIVGITLITILLGVFTGGFEASAGGIAAAVFFGLCMALIFKSKDKNG